MKIGPFMIGKDGGPDSVVDGWLFEIKSLFSVGILRFNDGSREAFHSHAFNCVSWVLKGALFERFLDPRRGAYIHRPGKTIVTRRDDIHKVSSHGTTYVLTVRGPWKKTWVDVTEVKNTDIWAIDTLSHGRGVVNTECRLGQERAADRAQQIARM